MMLPSGIRPLPENKLRADREDEGLYVVKGAYEGEYDLFSPSPLFPESQPGTDETEQHGRGQANIDISK